jgi:transcription initiation factor IIE alpha subunit
MKLESRGCCTKCSCLLELVGLYFRCPKCGEKISVQGLEAAVYLGRSLPTTVLEDLAGKLVESEHDRQKELVAMLSEGGKVLYEDEDSIHVQMPPHLNFKESI